jgi:hypothetical protein
MGSVHMPKRKIFTVSKSKDGKRRDPAAAG